MANVPTVEDIRYACGNNMDFFGFQNLQIVSFIFFRLLNFGKDDSAFLGEAQFGISKWRAGSIKEAQKPQGEEIVFMLSKRNPGARIAIGNPSGFYSTENFKQTL